MNDVKKNGVNWAIESISLHALLIACVYRLVLGTVHYNSYDTSNIEFSVLVLSLCTGLGLASPKSSNFSV